MTEKALVKACGVEFLIDNENSTHRKRNCGYNEKAFYEILLKISQDEIFYTKRKYSAFSILTHLFFDLMI